MKTTRLLGASGAALLTTALALALAPAAKAITVPDNFFTVTINVASLGLNPDAPFSLDLQLIPGSDNVTNTARIYNFSFTGGTTIGPADFTAGGESGSIGVNQIATLTNSSSDNEIAEEFSAGTTSISFNIDETPNEEVVGSGTPSPDQLNISIFGQSGYNITTLSPGGSDVLVTSDFGPSPLDTTIAYNGDGNGVTTIVATPEPSSTALSLIAAGGLLGLVLVRRRYAV